MSITFTPPEIRLDDAGQSADLTATVKRGSAPLTGATVALRSENPAVATVDPASAVTDGAGQVRVKVQAQSNGRTRVQAEAQGGANAAPVRVPGLSDVALVVLAILTIFLFLRRTRVRA